MTVQDAVEIPPSLLVSATYDSQAGAVVLKFYEPESQKIVHWTDNTGHKPYCYTRQPPSELGELEGREDVLGTEQVMRHDLIADKDVPVTKITVADPLAIGGTNSEKSIRNIMDTWESDIKYYENYLYDKSLVVGRYYSVSGGKVIPHDMPISDEVKLALKSLLWDKVVDEGMADRKEFREFIAGWADLLNQPIPRIRRLSFDIEVDSEEGRIPDPKISDRRVTAVGFAATDGLKQVFVLRSGAEEGENGVTPGVEVVFYDKEADMIRDALSVIGSYPFVLTYNGDDFDMPYMLNRARRLGVSDSDIPLYMMRDSATLRHGVHLDLYRTFSNRSFQLYAFAAKYTDYSLNSVTKAMLGEGKVDYGVKLGDLTLYQTANYCYHDARLTLELSTFGNEILMDLLVVTSRIARMPIDDMSRMGVSQWIRSLLYYEHRQRNALIPRRDELEGRSREVSNDAVIKDKKFRGGLVVEPEEGIHFDVTVMDFASLYPSIIKVRNLSYETVRCVHAECKKNTIPDTNHWVCTKNNGLTSMIIGSLRDLRVNYYKSLSKSTSITEEQRQQYTVISQALKVVLNASYGVMGAEIFPLYFLPAAEATTAVGRYIIMQTISHCEQMGVRVLYGDTDSLFIKDPEERQIHEIVEHAKKEHGVELEVDKEYRYVVLSNRKKNYFGVTRAGKVDVKGLTGKKSHTPPFIKELFYSLLDILSGVESEDEFESAKMRISKAIAACGKRLEERQIPLVDLAFNVMISKAPSEYVKTVPQHIRAARLLENAREVKKGDIISYVKVMNKTGVKPVEMARAGEVDTSKYLEFMESTLDQLTSSMGLDFDEILGKPKQTGMEQFFFK
uniref:DNA polymerase n=2 Tax=Cenarchaeum symbiosum TaxID=46770 RepID=O31096_CENSM|nr:archael family B DNA polymerase B [Cenarchaeum symbiosum]